MYSNKLLLINDISVGDTEAYGGMNPDLMLYLLVLLNVPIWGCWSFPTRCRVAEVLSESQKTISGPSEGKNPSMDLFDRWRFFRLILKLCPQRQVRHPFVHDLQDCWQTQRHLYISESARDQSPSPAQIQHPKPLHYTFSHLYTGSLVTTLPTAPNPTPRTWWQNKKEIPCSLLILIVLPKDSDWNPCNPTSPVHHCLCILYLLCPCFHPPSPKSSSPFFSQISHWLRTRDPVVCFSAPCEKRVC